MKPMNQQHIHCIIQDCHYYGQGNKCQAKEILVATDHFGANEADNVDCEMAAELTPQEASSCMSTCCKTFVPKGSKMVNADKVTKLS